MIPKEWFTGKHWEPLVVPAIVILVGLSAFALGRLSVVAGQGPLQVVAGENL
ncbi:MAG: hypothetical protein AAB919_00435 [Patescibacteria group bacterium]